MRILAIRGQNLASLAGEFAIDFTAEPLAGSGIFAITGPTGAGKSTVLDAVCLALFNDIPRLRAAPARGRIGENEDNGLSLQDPRAILRHGAGEGYAEVDFAMPDGAAYRARWSVKRAHGKADGKIQNYEHAFQRLDGAASGSCERMGGTRRETLAAIERVIGLTVEQFGRAVLLAQGDFEAFLRADANERAQLLERLTGSEIYTALGQRAFAKARDLETGLEHLRRRIADQNGLDDTQRAEAEAELAIAREAESEVGKRRDALKAARQWEDRAIALAEAIEKATDALETAKATNEAAAGRRAALARDRSALAQVPVWIALTHATARQTEAASELATAAQGLAAAKEDEANASKNEADALAAWKSAESDAQALAPTLTAARKLDVQINEAKRQLDNAETGFATGKDRLSQAHESHSIARDAHKQAQDAHAEEQNWLTANHALAALDQREDELAAQLADHTRHTADVKQGEANHAMQKAGQQSALTRWNEAESALADANDSHTKARQALAETEKALAPEGRLAELTEASNRLTQLDKLLDAHRHACEAQDTVNVGLTRTREKKRETEQVRFDLATAQAALTEQLPVLATKVADAQRELNLLRSAASETAEALRAALKPDEPCPVCGAVEHHFEVFTGKLGAQLVLRENAVAELDAEYEALRTKALSIDAELKAKDGSVENLNHDLAEQARLLDGAADKTADALITLGKAAREASLPIDPSALPEALATRRSEVDGALNALGLARQAAEAAREIEKKARTKADAARDGHTAAREALQARSDALRDLENRMTSDRKESDRLATVLDRWLAPVGDWRTAPHPAEWLAAEVCAWRNHAAKRDRLALALPALRDEETRTAGTLDTSKDAAEQLELVCQRTFEAHKELANERAALLDGESVTTAETRIAGARNSAENAREQAFKKQAVATNARFSAETRYSLGLKQRTDAETERLRCATNYTRALTAAGLTPDDVERVSAAGQTALDDETRELAELTNAVSTAVAVMREREADHAAHAQGLRPEISGADLVIALDEAEQACTNEQEKRTGAELVLRQDDLVRNQTAALRKELEQKASNAEVWLRLKDLIGDATGANFRRFAQGLTLDRLLEHANTRLSELKPRYTLERAAGGDMLVQVLDNDMGGEVRGLHNLSGGERFLVSLALALGLAEMSTACGVKIESLFIDEGFGALDPASLGQAIALLEHLHATGRRVGVISHVEDLKERIPVKIEVIPIGRGTSRIAVVGG